MHTVIEIAEQLNILREEIAVIQHSQWPLICIWASDAL